MKIKSKIAVIIAMLIATTLISCKDFLDQKPVSDLYTEIYWRSASDANIGLIAMYYSFSRAMASGFYDWGEMRGGNWQPNSRFGEPQRELIDHHVSNTNTACRWSELYQTINRANLAIKYIPNISMAPATKSRYLGEAYAVRALCYFYAVRVWGDVPVFLEPVEKFDANEIYPSRTRREKVLDIIEADLTKAEQFLPVLAQSSITTSTPIETTEQYVKRTRVSKPVVYAIQMDVYAWRHKYDMVMKVWEEKVKLLPNPTEGYGWALDPDIKGTLTQTEFNNAYHKMFDKSSISPLVPMSREQIFSIYYYKSENDVNQTTQYFIAPGRSLNWTTDLIDSYQKNSSGTIIDKRYEATINTAGARICKFYVVEPPLTTLQNARMSDNFLPVYRYSYLNLLYAEALNSESKMEDAILELNKIRTRSGLSPAFITDFVNPAELSDAILNEMRIETVTEGKYWFDLIRTGNAARLGGCTNPELICLPIFRDHLLQNPNLSKIIE